MIEEKRTEDVIKKLLGKIIRIARIKKKFTMNKLKKETGLKVKFISDIENGKILLKENELKLLEKVLNFENFEITIKNKEKFLENVPGPGNKRFRLINEYSKPKIEL